MRTFKKIFNSSNTSWDKSSEYNKMFLQTQQNYINDIFNALGYILLRDLYGLLGLPITKQSCIYGWYKGIFKGEDFVKFNFSQIEGTSDFELIFECYPVLDYLDNEESEA